MKAKEALEIVKGVLPRISLPLADHQKLAGCVQLIESVLPEEKDEDAPKPQNPEG